MQNAVSWTNTASHYEHTISMKVAASCGGDAFLQQAHESQYELVRVRAMRRRIELIITKMWWKTFRDYKRFGTGAEVLQQPVTGSYSQSYI